jgi:uncharacterized membrane protein AbrB (regulator of aidB expression)
MHTPGACKLLTQTTDTAAVLLAALLGYGIARLLGVPLPALLGPICTAALLAVWSPLRRPVRFPLQLRDGGLLLLGLAIGATLTPQAVGIFLQFPLVMALLAFTTGGAMAAGLWHPAIQLMDRIPDWMKASTASGLAGSRFSGGPGCGCK